MSTMAKSAEKIKARELRKKGYSIKQIAKRLKVSVGSASSWCKDVELTPEQIKILEQHSRDPYYGKRRKYFDFLKRTKELKIGKLKRQGVNKVGKLTKREVFLVGSALYWAEGFKKDKQAGLANQDPAMIKFFIKWLQECFGYKLSDLTARTTMNISHKHRTDEINRYWSLITSIPSSEFGNPIYQNFKWKKIYENPNEYYGVLRIKVRRSQDFLRKIYGFIEGLKGDFP